MPANRPEKGHFSITGSPVLEFGQFGCYIPGPHFGGGGVYKSDPIGGGGGAVQDPRGGLYKTPVLNTTSPQLTTA